MIIKVRVFATKTITETYYKDMEIDVGDSGNKSMAKFLANDEARGLGYDDFETWNEVNESLNSEFEFNEELTEILEEYNG